VEPRIRRTVGPDDAPGLARVAVAAWRAAYAGLMPEALLEAMGYERREARFREVLAPPLGLRGTWVAELADAGEPRAVGYASFGPCRDADATPGTGELYALYVLPALWGTGLGRELLARALGDLARRGLAPVTLWVLTGNARARRFYERAGFALEPGREREPKAVLGFELDHARYARP
jgi:RimJ/RimL family protein N-acetyltransferase